LRSRPLSVAVNKLRKGVHGGESCSTGAAVSESSCHCLPRHWGWKRRPFYVFFTPQRFETAKTQSRRSSVRAIQSSPHQSVRQSLDHLLSSASRGRRALAHLHHRVQRECSSLQERCGTARCRQSSSRRF